MESLWWRYGCFGRNFSTQNDSHKANWRRGLVQEKNNFQIKTNDIWSHKRLQLLSMLFFFLFFRRIHQVSTQLEMTTNSRRTKLLWITATLNRATTSSGLVPGLPRYLEAANLDKWPSTSGRIGRTLRSGSKYKKLNHDLYHITYVQTFVIQSSIQTTCNLQQLSESTHCF